VRTPPRILAVDDDPQSLEVARARLASLGYDVITAPDGEHALTAVREHAPDLILLDVMMPGLDGLEVCRRLRSDPSLSFMPIIIVTARADSADTVAGLDAGADEYLTKPLDHDALVARVRSILRMKALHDTVQTQAAQLADWNHLLEGRVKQQVEDLARLSRLKGFLSPQLAEVIVAGDEERLLESHRREITVVFCDLRGFTAFAEAVEPEEVMGVLQEYHLGLGELVFRFDGTLERFAGESLMSVFNDPVPVADPAGRAVRMALAMRARLGELSTRWLRRGHDLALAVGIATGYATLGKVAFAGRLDYAAIGSVTHLAARLCEDALPGQILLSQRVHAAVADLFDSEPVGERVLRGFQRPVSVYNVRGLKEPRTSGKRGSPLSPRELEVAALIARGLTNRQIGEALVVADRTVATHIEHILSRLSFSSRTQIGVWAAEHGLTSTALD
jgi:DNA-binding NarL/FixJ family response regulator